MKSYRPSSLPYECDECLEASPVQLKCCVVFSMCVEQSKSQERRKRVSEFAPNVTINKQIHSEHCLRDSLALAADFHYRLVHYSPFAARVALPPTINGSNDTFPPFSVVCRPSPHCRGSNNTFLAHAWPWPNTFTRISELASLTSDCIVYTSISTIMLSTESLGMLCHHSASIPA